MVRQKQIKFLSVADLAALTASGISSPEFAYVVSANAFYTRVSGVNTRIDPAGIIDLSLGTITTTTVDINVSGGGTNVTLPAATLSAAGVMTSADKNNIANLITLSGVAADATSLGTFTGTTIADNVTLKAALQSLETAVESKVNTSLLGVANGVATLDGTGKVPASHLPSFVDDVLEYANLAAFPATGTAGIIYVALDTNKIYRWGSSVYVEVSSAPAIPVTSVFGRTGAVVAANGDYTASQITNVAAGNIAATTVQAALNELDTEKQVNIQFQDEGVNVGTSGGINTVDFVGANVTVSQATGKLTVSIPSTFTDNYVTLTPTAQNTIPNLSPVPLSASKVKIAVNGILETTGISVNASGVFSVNATTLGYNIETTDVIQCFYLSA